MIYSESVRLRFGSSAPVFDCSCGGLVISTVYLELADGCLTDIYFCNHCGQLSIAKVKTLTPHWRTCPNHPKLAVR